jgi:hypothetical protein
MKSKPKGMIIQGINNNIQRNSCNEHLWSIAMLRGRGWVEWMLVRAVVGIFGVVRDVS